MKILVDTNIVLDVLLKNTAFLTHSKIIFDYVERKQISGFISASSITDIYFIARKRHGKEATKEALKKILSVFKPATVTDSHIYQALDLDWSDFEDSVQYVVGESLSVNYIITRNTKDFASSSIPVVTPEQFLEAITENET
ncbi:MAG: PIN domain-containing protein [Treponema sp.]|nr:PIN domain-containing protein [Treponema sp.]